MDLAEPVLNRVDDSNGSVGDVFRAACQDLGTIAAKAKPDPVNLADRVFAACRVGCASEQRMYLFFRLIFARIHCADIFNLTRLHQLAGVGETKSLKSLGGESKGRHYRK